MLRIAETLMLVQKADQVTITFLLAWKESSSSLFYCMHKPYSKTTKRDVNFKRFHQGSDESE